MLPPLVPLKKKKPMDQEDELIRENDKTLIINTHNAVQALQERVEGPHVGKRHNVILTNPPFGIRGAGGAPSPDDFLVSTSNKQLNFVQYTMTLLKIGGHAAIIVPDNVLFENSGEEVRVNLMQNCDLHTILRLPEGTFSSLFSRGKGKHIFLYKRSSNDEYLDLRFTN